MKLKKYADKAEAFATELTREHYQVGAGLKETMEVSPIYERHADLFTPANVKQRLAERDGSIGMRMLANMAAGGYLENAVKRLSEEITNAELAATVEWDGQRVPYRQVRVLSGREPDWRRRHDLHRRMNAVTGTQHDKRAERIRQLHALAQQLGFAGYIPMVESLKGLDLRGLAAQLTDFLQRTDALYQLRFERMLERWGVPTAAANTSDVIFGFRAAEFDGHFPAAKLVPALRQTVAGLGLARGDELGFVLDIEERPRKSPRAFCAAVRVPEEVYLVLKPYGGADDYNTLFHEAGHAEHFSHVAADVPFQMRRLWDSDVAETYAFLFQYLLHNRRFLGDVIGLPAAAIEGYVRQVTFEKLWFLRRYAAKLRYELVLHDTGPDAAPDAYVRELTAAMHMAYPAENALSDVDDGFYAAQYLRAWLFEADLRRHLERTFGEAWWQTPDAGAFLKGWWERGQDRAVPELARAIGLQGVTTDGILADVLDV